MKQIFIVAAMACFTATAFSQKNKLPEITLKDFEPRVYSLDSNAQAVVLYDGGTVKYEANGDSWFTVVYNFRKRIRILNKNAFSAATIEIPLYKGERAEEKVLKLEAATYSPENGAVVKTILDKANVFRDKSSGRSVIEKFTFPNIKVGSIIEYSYTLESPFTNNLRSWFFQEIYPVLTSEFEANIPDLFNFAILNNGYYELVPEVKNNNKSFNIPAMNEVGGRMVNYDATIVTTKWSMSSLAPLTRENYITTLQNHVSKVDFQLRSINYPNAIPRNVLETWEELSASLLKSDHFGVPLNERNIWMEDDLKPLVVNNDELATAKNLYNFIRSSFTCTDLYAVYIEENLKNTYKLKKGNIAEINLLLTSMLRKAGIKADPVILSTRENGYAPEYYPLLNKFNYVICRAMINGKEVLLDASNKKLGFNHLLPNCYNGTGRVIGDNPILVVISADSLREMKNTNIYIVNDLNSKKLSGSFYSTLGYYESFDLRESIAANGREEYLKSLKNEFSYDPDMKNVTLDSLMKPEERMAVGYDFVIEMDEDIVYYNPLMSEAYKSNPFSAAKRSFPVEMPYTFDELITVSMEIPKGYTVDELPKSVRINLNESEGIFEYIIQADKEKINLKCKVKLNRANFPPEDYETLRDFYSQVVKKQNEQIVFKKIK